MENDPDSPAPATVPPSPAEGPKPSRTERRVQASADALRTLLRDLHFDRHGADLPAGEIELTLRLRADPARQWQITFDPPIVEQLDEQFADAKAERDVYRKGAVYCFRCNASTCDHATPPASLSVFHGYDETGRPEWIEFHQALIELKNDRVDQLYGRPPAVLTSVQFGRQLRGRQLSSFGRSSRTYAVLGQVIAGYFPLPRAAGPGTVAPEKLAVTFQVVEARDADGSPRLHLNALARLPEPVTLDELLGGGWQPDVFRARGIAVRSLAALEHRVRGAREGGRHEQSRELLRHIPSILHRIADALDRGHRQTRRRTQHAEQRRQENRPVHKALEDSRDARTDDFFFDLKAQTFIVCGPKGRTHAFNAAGKHVTSFMIKPDTIEFRLRTERWRRGEAEEFSAFREKLEPKPES